MRIGFNLLYVLPDVPGGTETYARELIHAMVKLERPHTYIAFVSRSCERLIQELEGYGVDVRTAPFDSRNRMSRYLWEQTFLPKLACAARVDVLHSLGYVAPLRQMGRSVVTIHDLNFVRAGRGMSLQRRLALSLFVRATARLSDHIITISEFSGEEIRRYLGAPADRITVIPLGPPDTSYPRTCNGAHDMVPPEPYIVAFSGAGSPHKNIARFVRAFLSSAVSRTRMLVLVGRPPAELSPKSARVRTVGSISRPDLLGLLSRAEIFAMPSLYEGFGLPILEAQTLGIPVMCSRAAALPEVAGTGALLFDPLDEADIASALDRVAADAGVRHQLIREGARNAARFSWESAARQTLEVYERVAAKPQTSHAECAEPCES